MRRVIIIGAPRSGTNMLRDVLTRVPGFATWPCDEINLMWRHGHRDHPSDELPARFATAESARYMGRQFAKIGRKYDARVVVEKTCANSLRVPYVDRCVPEVRYLFITRDGIDAVPSAMRRWHAPFDLRYAVRKARYVPMSDVPYYGVRFVTNRFRSRRSGAVGRDHVGSWWGPKLDDRVELMRRHPLDELCAIQWQRCVDASERGFADVPAERVHRIRYEEFVTDPVPALAEVLAFLGEPTNVAPDWVADVSAASVGKGRTSLGPETVERLRALVGPTLERLGHG